MRAAVVGADDARTRRVARDLSESGLQTRVVHDGEAFDAEIVVGCLFNGPDAEVSAARDASAGGAIYLSGSGSPEAVRRLFDLGGEVPDSPVLVGCGWTPGLSGVLARLAAEEFDTDIDVTVAWVRPVGSPGGVPLNFGGWAEEVYFPEPLGWRKVRDFFGAETITIPRSVPSAQQVRVKGAFTGSQGSRILGRVALRPGSSFDSWSSVRVDVSVGDSQTVSLAVLDQFSNLDASPLVAAVVMVSRGELAVQGVQSLDSAVDPGRFLQALSERGLRVARLHRHDS